MANNIIGTVGVGAQSVKPDWNQNDPHAKDYIKNRPGGYAVAPSFEITWDGDTTGKETIVVPDNRTLVKIADEAPPIEKFAVKSDVATFAAESGPSYAATITVDLTDRNNNTETKQVEFELFVGDGFWFGKDQIVIVLGIVADRVSFDKYTFSKGLWVSVLEASK